MPEYGPGDMPGHLDTDAVSAYIDRDVHPDEFALISLHLRQCPACDQEVLEVRTTVFLLQSLPQYEPRRSFCLGKEHARAARRRGAQPVMEPEPGPLAMSPLPPMAASASPEPARGGGWLPGLQIVAMVTGVLLLLVTVGDWRGMSPDLSPQNLAAPTAAAGLPVAQAPQVAMPQESLPAFSASDGTNLVDSASQDVSEGVVGRSGAVSTAGAGAASVSRAIGGSESGPTAEKAAESGQVDSAAPAAPAAEPAPAASDTASPVNQGPSRLRLIQLALLAILLWLVVTIVGMRWLRRLR
ncbi:MAG: zf-HC2 domain-containing protein [Thermomicrobiales bacterium]